MADRIELESKLTELERTVEALSGELHQHNRRIDALQAAVVQLAEQLKQKRADGDGGEALEPHDSRPPHYRG